MIKYVIETKDNFKNGKKEVELRDSFKTMPIRCAF